MERYSRRSDLLRGFEKLRKQVDKVRPAGRDDAPYTPYRVKQRLDAGTRSQLVSDYESGTPTTQLTVTYQLSKASVLKLLGEADVNLRRQGLDEQQTVEAIRLYRTGLSLARVGEQLGFAPTSVRNALKAAGVVLRGRHDWLS